MGRIYAHNRAATSQRHDRFEHTGIARTNRGAGLAAYDNLCAWPVGAARLGSAGLKGAKWLTQKRQARNVAQISGALGDFAPLRKAFQTASKHMNTRLDNKTVVVTGGAGGIGSAICEACAAAGAHLVITYNSDAEKASRLAARLPGEHLVAHAPVDDSAALADLAEQVRERFGRLDVLVNNAGITRTVPHANLDALDDELIDQIFRVNWRGAFAAARAFRPLLDEGEGGVIVNISSIAGTTGFGSNIAYCASKAALDSLTRSLARALAPRIRVLSIAPGWVEGEYAQRFDPALLDQQRQRTPLGRIAYAEEVANAVLAAATVLTFSTGDIIHVDGGRRLGN